MALRHGTWVSQETPGIGVTSPLDARLAMAGTLVKDTTGKARSGVFYDGTSNIVSGTAGMSYQIARAVFVQARSVADGAIVFANDGTINVTTTAAPAANSRIDIVYVWHRDFVTDGQNSDPLAGVVQGAASPTPVAPAIPDGAVELARATVTANATATNGLVIDQTSQFTAAAGGIVPFRTKAALDAWTTATPRQYAEVFGETAASNGLYQRVGNAWVDVLGDTGWIVPTIVGGWAVDGAQSIGYRRKNGLVFLRGRVTGGGTGTVFTLPAGFRPGQFSPYLALDNVLTTAGARVLVTPSGEVQAVVAQRPDFAVVSFIAEA